MLTAYFAVILMYMKQREKMSETTEPAGEYLGRRINSLYNQY